MKPLVQKFRTRLMASAAMAAGLGVGSMTASTVPVLAEPVTVEAPQILPSFADVVERVSPAVVSVRVKSDMQPVSHGGSDFSFGGEGFGKLPEDHPLRRFFNEFGDRQFDDQPGGQHSERARPMAQGSGFFISEDGYLVTNNHVVEGGSEFMIVMDDGTEIDAKLVGTDPRTDLALLKVDEDREFTYVALAKEPNIRVGDWVVAVGNPFGLGGSVTAGIVSARGRDIGAGPYDDFLQIDAAVNRGSSGGPAFNLSGEVVGINTAIFSPSGGNVGIGFAIPASTAKGVIAELMEDGSVERGWLGVQIQTVTDDIAASLGLEEAAGAIVVEAQDDGPAQIAGIEAGDVITDVDGKTIESTRELSSTIAEIDPKKETVLTVWRDGKSQEISVELGELPDVENHASSDKPAATPAKGEMLEDLGLTVVPDNSNGLIVTDVQPDSDAAERGIQAGDVILEVNSTEVSSAKDVEKAIADASKSSRKSVLVRIERDDTSRFLALPVSSS